MREKIYHVIEPGTRQTKGSKAYDAFMIVVIILSLIPLMFKEMTPALYWLDWITVSIFIIDYILRWITADFYLKEEGRAAFLKYPFTPMAILDLLTILPSLNILFRGLKAIRFIRLAKALRVVIAFRSLRYIRSIDRIQRMLRKQWAALLTVIILALMYILVTALIMFQVEPFIFDNFIDALYWATVSLSTAGYGDIVPVTMLGKVITTISMLVGMLLIAIPAGIITAGYLEETRIDAEKEEEIDRKDG